METENTTANTSENKSMKMKKMYGIIAVLVVLIIVGVLYQRNNTPEKIQARENAKVLASVSKLILVPSEQPVIANINQADTLIKEQAFYSGSENGDKLIIYPKAQKAIIYSPKRNIIVNSGPFIVNQNK